MQASLKQPPGGARSPRRGTALIAAVTMILTLAVFATAYLSLALDSSRQTGQQADLGDLKRGAESAIALAAHEIWSGYLAAQNGQAGSLASFRAYADGIGLAPDASGTLSGAAAAPGTDVLNLVSLGKSTQGKVGMDGIDLSGLTAARFDDATTTSIVLSARVTSRRGATGATAPLARTVQQVYVVEPGEWNGLDYALLANNVNCIMCHTEIDSAERFFNRDPNLYGSFDRIRVGTLENLLLRPNNGSQVAGSLYVRGNAVDKSGTPIADWSLLNFHSVAFDAAGLVQEDAWGQVTPTIFSPADPAAPQPFENLYLDYTLDTAKMVDGYLPQAFPAPFPDDGVDPLTGAVVPGAAGNRIVDPVEFATAAKYAQGSVAGGSITTVVPGDVLTAGQLTNALTTGSQPSLPSVTTGNVVLTGTQTDPIVLNGDVAIDGDLIIGGYVKGEGSLVVSGNVYVPADVKYLDGTNVTSGGRTYGVAADGTTNNVAIASGGSIIVGDLFYTKKTTTPPPSGYDTGSFNFVLSELGLFNRAEWSKTQPVLPGPGEDVTNPTTWTQTNPGYAGPGYYPRYYSMVEGGDIPFFLPSNGKVWFDGASGSWQGKEHGGDWNTVVAHPQNPTDPILYDPSGAPKAAVHALTASGGWIPDSLLRQMMQDAIANRPNSPVEIDGTLYTNNSIFGIVGKATPALGSMILNGALVAADVGLLVPGNGGTGLFLNYDKRGKGLLKLKDGERVTIRRRLSALPAAN